MNGTSERIIEASAKKLMDSASVVLAFIVVAYTVVSHLNKSYENVIFVYIMCPMGIFLIGLSW